MDLLNKYSVELNPNFSYRNAKHGATKKRRYRDEFVANFGLRLITRYSLLLTFYNTKYATKY